MDWPVISLETNDRGLLNRQLKTRFEAMLSAGFAYEVRALRQRGDWSPALPSMRCVGYRHAWEALDAADPPALGPLRERAQAATRQLVKRQITWLRSMRMRISIDIDSPDLDTRLAAALRAVITRS